MIGFWVCSTIVVDGHQQAEYSTQLLSRLSVLNIATVGVSICTNSQAQVSCVLFYDIEDVSDVQNYNTIATVIEWSIFFFLHLLPMSNIVLIHLSLI